MNLEIEMINGKSENESNTIREGDKELNVSTELSSDEPMDVDASIIDIHEMSQTKLDGSIVILNQNNTNGCTVVSPGIQNSFDYFNCETGNKEAGLPNKDTVDDTGDLYADDDEARPTGHLEHKFTNISQYKELDPGREKKLLSESIKIRCLPWKILLMFRVASNAVPFDLKQRSMGIFLQCNADCETTSWNCNAKAKITLVSQKQAAGGGELPQTSNETESQDSVPTNHDVVRTIEHNFYSKENDWGFSSFITLAELFNAEKGFVLDDSIIVRIQINADAPHGIDWDSKRHTGFVGLKNQGATCYLNSLLQTLFFTNKLRRAVYMMPTYSDEPQVSVPLALQRVFYELQFSDKAVGTKKLTRSFGWETLDSFMQHDAQELCRVLMDNMENKMKGTSVENMIPSLFCGKMLSYIKCKHVPMESAREENFYDIQLKVKNNSTIYEAFQEYINVESLDNDNKYDAGEYGLQEAEKGVIFVNFPPVLYLQLMRFQFDFATENNVKINDKFEFYYKLDLSKYLKQNTGSTEQCSQYFLHAVLVHSGDNHGGHYVVYLNPRGDNKWYKFDDDVVSRCSVKEAIQMNYGGYEEDLGVRQCTNAYMLVYMAETAKDDILGSVSVSEISQPLLDRFAKEQTAEAQKRREKAESHLFTCVYLLLEEDFYGWQGFDLCNTADAPSRKIRVSKSASLDELTTQICETLRLPTQSVRLWHMKQRKNQTSRVTILDFKENFLKQDINFYFWVETVPVSVAAEFSPAASSVTGASTDEPNSSSIDQLYPFDINSDLLVFLKFYEPHTHSVHYCGHVFIRIQSPLQLLLPQMRQRASLLADTPLLVFEERKPLCLEPLNTELKIEQCVEVLMDGNILVFQRQPDHLDDNSNDDDSAAVANTAVEYFNDFFHQNEVLFLDKNHPDEASGFVLRLSGKLFYHQMAASVGHYLNHSSDRLQFFRSQPGFSNKEVVGNVVRSTYSGELKELLAHYPRNKNHKRMYYERLSMPVEELENMRQISCMYVNEKLNDEVLYTVNLNRSASVQDLIIAILRQLNLRPGGTPSATPGVTADDDQNSDQISVGSSDLEDISQRYRVFEISSCKILQQYSLDTKISQITFNINRHLRVEETPADELQLEPNEELIYVAHFHKDSYSTFGIPFALKIRDGETFSAVKERIKKRLDVADKEFDKWRFAIVSGRATYLPDEPESVVSTNAFHCHSYNTLTGTRPWLGIEHKPSKRPRATGCEKPIKIHN